MMTTIEAPHANAHKGGFAIPAKIISLLLHPLFIPIYVVAFLLFLYPPAFPGFSDFEKYRVLVISIINLVIFPLITVLLLKGTGFISSIYMRTQKDRIIPYIACGIFYFWAYTIFKEQTHYPRIWVAFLFGIFLASSAALIANIYLKVSMHAIGFGGLTCFFLLLVYQGTGLVAWPLSLALLLSGLGISSRLYLKEHTSFEVYPGFAIGVVGQLIGYWFVMR